MVIEKRHERRFQAPDLDSELSDGKAGFFVVVDDVSLSGIGMGQVPEGFDSTVQKCLAVVNATAMEFKLSLQPCWVHSAPQDHYKKIGFKIEDPSDSWLDFVRSVMEGSQIDCERNHERLQTQGLMALISDGKNTFYSVVEDLSESGMRLSQVPQDLDESASHYSVVIESPAGDVRVSMKPCWLRVSKKGMYKTIGFRVHNPPDGWQNLISSLANEESNLSFLVLEDEEEQLEENVKKTSSG